MHHPPTSEEAIFHRTSTHRWIPSQFILPIPHLERRERDLLALSDSIRGNPEVSRLDLFVVDMELVVASVIRLGPLQFGIIPDEKRADVVGLSNGDVRSEWAGAGYGRPREFYPDRSRPRSAVVSVVVEPDDVADPVGVTVSRKKDVVANVVFVEVLECPVAVREIAVPSIDIKGVLVAK